MGPLFVLLFWGVICGALIVGAGAVSALLWFLVRPKRPLLKAVLIGGPFVIAAAPVAVLAVLLGVRLLESPEQKFAAVFGARPPPSISQLHAQEEFGSDFEEVRLAFHARPQALDGLTTSLTPLGEESGLGWSLMKPGPPWWKPGNCAPAERYIVKTNTQQRWDDIVIARCGGEVFVYAAWID